MRKYNFNATRKKQVLLVLGLLTLAVLLGRCPAARALEMGGDFGINLEHAGNLVFNFDTAQIEELSGGVQLTLLPDDPDQPPMPISADSIRFSYAGPENSPSHILMQGNVRIRHPQGNIEAGRAEWDFESETLVFTENPRFSSEQVRDLRGEEIVVNFATGKVNVRGGAQGELPAFARGGMGGASTSGPQLREGDIDDWAGLINTLKEQTASESPSPGGHIVAMLEPNMRNALMNTPTEVLVEQRQMLLRQFNTLIQRNDLYDEAAWSGVNIPAPAQALLAQEARSPEEVAAMNLGLLAAAFPNAISGS